MVSAPAVEHEEEIGESAPIWAVSYADLLMVLMSFFVIFYEMKPEANQSGTLYKLALGLGTKGAQPIASVPANPEKPLTGKGDTKTEAKVPLLEGILKASTRGTSLATDGDIIILSFDIPVFEKGEYKIDAHLKEQLQRVAEAVRPSADKLEITVVGHADSTALAPRNEFLKDNFDLSSLRALRAMKVLMASGIPRSHLLVQGASDNQKSARTLTLRIKSKEAAK